MSEATPVVLRKNGQVNVEAPFRHKGENLTVTMQFTVLDISKKTVTFELTDSHIQFPPLPSVPQNIKLVVEEHTINGDVTEAFES